MKVIELTVSATGESRIETRGFSGNECREADEFLRRALGQTSQEQTTHEFFSEPVRQQSTTGQQL